MTFVVLLVAAALAQDLAINQEVDGGLSVDATGVSADGTSTWLAGEDFLLQVPSGAALTDAWLAVLAEPLGFAGEPGEQTRLNGVGLDSATLLSASDRSRLYLLDLEAFAVQADRNGYEELGDADVDGSGIAGAVLAVTWEHPDLGGRRHVVFGTTDLEGTDLTVNRTPSGQTMQEVIASFAIAGSCSDDQDASAWVDSSLAATYAGGRDDGVAYDGSCGSQDEASRITAGSFGYDDGDVAIGVDGDQVDAEPGGDSQDSRRSDELWQVRYTETGSLELRFGGTGGGGYVGAFALAIELDEDEDGVADAHDNCVEEANEDQLDTDGDGLGNACDVCVDEDGDGNGVHGPESCATDCDDTDPDVNPDAAEDWYDGVDQDCDGGSDFDQDGDGHDIEGVGGDDCDDFEVEVHGGHAEVCDELDNDCDGRVDDEDDDLTRPETWYVDEDGDDYGSTEVILACDQPEGTAANGDDCDDEDPDVHPHGWEICDPEDTDEDCDGLADDDDPDVDEKSAWYEDRDGDGYGRPDSEFIGCDPPPDWIQDGTDCDDYDAEAFPGSDGWTEDCEPVPRNDLREDDDVCGCAAGPSGGWGWLAVLALGWRRRSRS